LHTRALVLIGNDAPDDPEGQAILETIKSSIDERIIVLAVDDPILVMRGSVVRPWF
jgi:trehalose synthase